MQVLYMYIYLANCRQGPRYRVINVFLALGKVHIELFVKLLHAVFVFIMAIYIPVALIVYTFSLFFFLI